MPPLDLNDPDTKKAVDDLIAQANADLRTEMEESTRLLQENNARLTRQLRDARNKNPEESTAKLAELEDKVSTLTAQLEKATNEAKKAQGDFAKQLDAANKKYESESAYTARLLRDNGLQDALIKAKVAPEFMKAAAALHKEAVQIVAEGDARVAKIGDKPLADFITEWAQSDEGKHYVAAPANSGGGASGSNGEGGKPVVNVTDQKAFGANLEAIANGSAKVSFGPE
jgi:hypothetical protein